MKQLINTRNENLHKMIIPSETEQSLHGMNSSIGRSLYENNGQKLDNLFGDCEQNWQIQYHLLLNEDYDGILQQLLDGTQTLVYLN